MATHDSWTIAGSEGLDLPGDTHAPDDPRAAAIIVHGYKGYKDYGMFPLVAERLARAGVVAHRFNLAHSGMTNDIGTFARPGLFERDTWRFQAEDIAHVAHAIRAGTLAGSGLPLFLIGHSRGGTASVLAAAWFARELDLAGLVTINAPDTCCSLPDAERERLLRDGFLPTVSSRTGQTLRVGRAWLQEQLDDPAAHNPLAQAARVRCPALVIHGQADETVPPDAGERLSAALGARLARVPAGNHVLNTPNPTPADADPSAALAAALEACVEFATANL